MMPPYPPAGELVIPNTASGSVSGSGSASGSGSGSVPVLTMIDGTGRCGPLSKEEVWRLVHTSIADRAPQVAGSTTLVGRSTLFWAAGMSQPTALWQIRELRCVRVCGGEGDECGP
jgi:hypothetical protein